MFLKSKHFQTSQMSFSTSKALKSNILKSKQLQTFK